MRRLAEIADRTLDRLLRAAAWLALPVALLLFLQWPLRDLARAGSREANDLAQWLFALHVAVAVTAATRAGVHLAAEGVARRWGDSARSWLRRAGAGLVLLPWALFTLITAWPMVAQSVRGLEAFAETANPGYFLVKAAVWLMALLVGAWALRDMA